MLTNIFLNYCMETLGNKIDDNSTNYFCCNICNYNTCHKGHYKEHLNSLKHIRRNKMETNGNKIDDNSTTTVLQCNKCNKSFSSRSGLWKHKQNCFNENVIIVQNNNDNDNSIIDSHKEEEIIALKEIMKYLMKENSEMKNMIMDQQNMMMEQQNKVIEQQNIVLEVVKNGTMNNSHNTTNSHNKAFNLNFFLNETCKEAMNIGEFVDSLKIQLSDLEKVGEVGYIEGISNIIVKNLKELDVTKRPVHCTDKKRETVYIKDNNIWEKDEDKSKMHKLIKKVAFKNVNMFQKFKEKHPDCMEYHSQHNDQYHKIIYESMGGKGDDDSVKNDKIIKNVLKEVVIDKN